MTGTLLKRFFYCTPAARKCQMGEKDRHASGGFRPKEAAFPAIEKREGLRPSPYRTSKTVSRVLYLAVIYLGGPLPDRSSHLLRTAGPALRPPAVLLRIEFTASDSLQPMGELLPRLSTLATTVDARRASTVKSCAAPRWGRQHDLRHGGLFLLHFS